MHFQELAFGIASTIFYFGLILVSSVRRGDWYIFEGLVILCCCPSTCKRKDPGPFQDVRINVKTVLHQKRKRFLLRLFIL